MCWFHQTTPPQPLSFNDPPVGRSQHPMRVQLAPSQPQRVIQRQHGSFPIGQPLSLELGGLDSCPHQIGRLGWGQTLGGGGGGGPAQKTQNPKP